MDGRSFAALTLSCLQHCDSHVLRSGPEYGQRSHLVTAEYWRWWVVHLWVEGFFEVFATVVIAFLFTRLKLLEILRTSFWCINLGLVFMVLLSMLPMGLLQAWASIEHGTWYARSAEFLQSGTMQSLRWLRVPGDVFFAVGAALLGWFVLGLLTGHSFEKNTPQDAEANRARNQAEELLAH